MVRPANDNRRNGPTLGAWVLITIAVVTGIAGIAWSLLKAASVAG